MLHLIKDCYADTLWTSIDIGTNIFVLDFIKILSVSKTFHNFYYPVQEEPVEEGDDGQDGDDHEGPVVLVVDVPARLDTAQDAGQQRHDPESSYKINQEIHSYLFILRITK